MCPNAFKMQIKSIGMQNKYTLSWYKPWLFVFKQFSWKHFSGMLDWNVLYSSECVLRNFLIRARQENQRNVQVGHAVPDLSQVVTSFHKLSQFDKSLLLSIHASLKETNRHRHLLTCGAGKNIKWPSIHQFLSFIVPFLVWSRWPLWP